MPILSREPFKAQRERVVALLADLPKAELIFLSDLQPEASWVYFALKTFGTTPPKHGGKAIVASRMIAVIQGWDVTAMEIAAQQRAAKKAGANGCVVAFDQIEQSGSPKVVRWK